MQRGSVAKGIVEEPFPPELGKSIEDQEVNKQAAAGHTCLSTTMVCPEFKQC